MPQSKDHACPKAIAIHQRANQREYTNKKYLIPTPPHSPAIHYRQVSRDLTLSELRLLQAYHICGSAMQLMVSA